MVVSGRGRAGGRECGGRGGARGPCGIRSPDGEARTAGGQCRARVQSPARGLPRLRVRGPGCGGGGRGAARSVGGARGARRAAPHTRPWTVRRVGSARGPGALRAAGRAAADPGAGGGGVGRVGVGPRGGVRGLVVLRAGMMVQG